MLASSQRSEPEINSSQNPHVEGSGTDSDAADLGTNEAKARLSILHLMAWAAGVAIAISLLTASHNIHHSTVIKLFYSVDQVPPPVPPISWPLVIQSLFYGTGIAFAGFAICNKRFFFSPGMMLLTLIGIGALLEPLLLILSNKLLLEKFVPGQPMPTWLGMSLWGFNVHVGYLTVGCLSLFFFFRTKTKWLCWRPVFLAFALTFLLNSGFIVDFDYARVKARAITGVDLLFLASWSLPCAMVVFAFLFDLIRRTKIDWWTVVASSVFTLAWAGLIASRILTRPP